MLIQLPRLQVRCLYAVLGAVPQVIDVHSSLRPHQLVALTPQLLSPQAKLQGWGSTVTVGISSPHGWGLLLGKEKARGC